MPSCSTIESCHDFARRVNRLVITHIPETFKLRLGAFDANSLIDPQFGRKPWQKPEASAASLPTRTRGTNGHQPL